MKYEEWLLCACLSGHEAEPCGCKQATIWGSHERVTIVPGISYCYLNQELTADMTEPICRVILNDAGGQRRVFGNILKLSLSFAQPDWPVTIVTLKGAEFEE